MIAAPNDCGFVDLPVLGVANQPSAELNLLIGDMDRVLGSIKKRLNKVGATFEQALAIYNEIPVSATAADLGEAAVSDLIDRHLKSA